MRDRGPPWPRDHLDPILRIPEQAVSPLAPSLEEEPLITCGRTIFDFVPTSNAWQITKKICLISLGVSLTALVPLSG